MDKVDQKERLFKILENIKGKNEKPLKSSSAANEVSNGAKNESELNYDSLCMLFMSLTETLKKLRERSHWTLNMAR